MRFIIHDIIGTMPAQGAVDDDADDDPKPKRRAVYLRELLEKKKLTAEEWENLTPEAIKPEGTVVLAHLTDAGLVKDEMEALAEKGGLVVFYSGGQFIENEKQKGEGWVYWRRWDSLDEAIGSVEARFEQLDFKKVLDNPPRRNLMAAVAILSWCASAQVSDRAVQQRQKQWRESREKWQQVFRDVSEQEFLQAVCPGGDTAPNWPAGLSKVEQLVKWVKWVRPEAGGASEPEAPDHAKVLEELQHTFRWKL